MLNKKAEFNQVTNIALWILFIAILVIGLAYLFSILAGQ